MNRKKRTSEDAALEREIEDSLKVSSYLDNVLESIQKGQKVDINVPQYGTPGGNSGSLNESSSLFPMDTDYMASVAAKSLGMDTSLFKQAAVEAETASETSPKQTGKAEEGRAVETPKFTISAKQYKAIQKYPSLIEFLGTNDSEKIVSEILAKVNSLMVQRIAKNSKALNKCAEACVSERKNIKQYFVGEDKGWVCCVIASGPFRGDEAFYFDRDADKSSVLRPRGEKWEDVSDQFNIVHEYAENE